MLAVGSENLDREHGALATNWAQPQRGPGELLAAVTGVQLEVRVSFGPTVGIVTDSDHAGFRGFFDHLEDTREEFSLTALIPTGQIPQDFINKHGQIRLEGGPMGERFSEIEKASIGERSLEERLKEYPELKAKIETMLSIIENAGGDVEKAAEAERRIIEEMRQIGNEVLHGWARRQQQKKEEEYNAKPGANRKEKKRSTGTHGLEKSK